MRAVVYKIDTLKNVRAHERFSTITSHESKQGVLRRHLIPNITKLPSGTTKAHTGQINDKQRH